MLPSSMPPVGGLHSPVWLPCWDTAFPSLSALRVGVAYSRRLVSSWYSLLSLLSLLLLSRLAPFLFHVMFHSVRLPVVSPLSSVASFSILWAPASLLTSPCRQCSSW